ncbi:AAA family ATPase [Estrella lausannensis]|uniref:Putative chromosome partioning protein n=1 Tax=Estrella lausannensis TaxID=483423 RepID=A0A0H5DSA0_9BACT|nr:AAA family ATPase [Estrella lausannensis]CRX39591.1 putative chromosome partioning protein [Estrella lausannensis]
MKVISSVGAKGGSGKSSVSLVLAWELAQTHKAKVVLFDADVQGTCVSAKALNPEMPFEVISVINKTDLWEKGKQYAKNGYDYLIVDGNPRSLHEDPAMIEVIAKLSDLNLIISRPSPRDLKAQIKYVDLVKKATAGQTRILWNFFQKNTAAHKEGVPEGEELLGIPSLNTKMGLRVAYQDIGYTEGYVGGLNNAEATKEIKALGKEIKGLLHGKK